MIMRFRCFFLRLTGKFSSQIGKKSELKTSGFYSGPKCPWVSCAQFKATFFFCFTFQLVATIVFFICLFVESIGPGAFFFFFFWFVYVNVFFFFFNKNSGLYFSFFFLNQQQLLFFLLFDNWVLLFFFFFFLITGCSFFFFSFFEFNDCLNL